MHGLGCRWWKNRGKKTLVLNHARLEIPRKRELWRFNVIGWDFFLGRKIWWQENGSSYYLLSHHNLMKTKSKPQTAWGMTVAAALDLIALVLLASSNTEANTLILFAACEFLLIMGAVYFWKQYFEDLIEPKLGEGE